MDWHEHGPFRAHACIADLAGVLRDAGYTTPALADIKLLSGPARPDLPLHERHRRVAGDSKFEVLARLLVLASEEHADAVARALAPIPVDALLACGLIRASGEGRVRANASIVPSAELYFAREFSRGVTGIDQQIEVLPVGRSSVMTAMITPRGRGETVLDLGCGQGLHTVLASDHAERVVGTDVSRRALNFASFSVALNHPQRPKGMAPARVELRHGSLFEPVEDLRGGLDLIVSNPPFAIIPDRDAKAFSGMEGDRIMELLVRGAGAFLREGGWCASLGTWHSPDAGSWSDRPMEWARGLGCDVLLGRFKTESPREYAMQWIREVHHGRDATPVEIEEWLRYYDRLGAGAMTFGFIVMRKRAGGANWSDTMDTDLDVSRPPAGNALRRMFASRTLLSKNPTGTALLHTAFERSPTLELRTTSVARDGSWDCTSARFEETAGFPVSVQATPDMAELLGKLDGRTPLGAIVGAMASAAGADPQQTARGAIEQIKPLMTLGLVAPA